MAQCGRRTGRTHNTYNPNSVAPPEMKLLYDSIKEDGYTMPIVCYYVKSKDVYVIVDGFHRYRIMLEHDVDLMSNILGELHELGRSDEWVSQHLGMDMDEILRLKQLTGLKALFREVDFGKAWEPGDTELSKEFFVEYEKEDEEK